MSHFIMYYIYIYMTLTGKPFYPLKLKLLDTLKTNLRMKDILLMISEPAAAGSI